LRSHAAARASMDIGCCDPPREGGEDRREGASPVLHLEGLCSDVRRPRASMDTGAATIPAGERIGARGPSLVLHLEGALLRHAAA